MRVRLGSLCTAGLLAVAAGCGPASKTEKPLAGQPTMNELMHRTAQKNEQEGRRRRELEVQSRAMSQADAEAAEAAVAELKKRPDDPDLFRRVHGYYRSHSDVLGLTRVTLWHIEHHPNGKLEPWTIHPAWDARAWRRGADLWRQNLKRQDATAETWRRAARYLEGGSKEEVERILLEAKQRFPNDQWTRPLSELYALTLMGARGPRSEGNTVRETSAAEANSPFAQAVRRKLLQSDDPRMLMETARYIVQRWQPGRPEGVLDTAQALAARAVELAPPNSSIRHFGSGIEAHIRTIERRTTPLDKLSDPDQMVALLSNLSNGAYPSADGLTEEQKARRLLELAARHKDHKYYGFALHTANYALARVALKGGDRKSAVRFLLASTEVPQSEGLRFGYIDMTIARQLVDWGERSAVAEFLERCSKFNFREKELAQWAADIRRGINPDLTPYRMN